MSAQLVDLLVGWFGLLDGPPPSVCHNSLKRVGILYFLEPIGELVFIKSRKEFKHSEQFSYFASSRRWHKAGVSRFCATFTNQPKILYRNIHRLALQTLALTEDAAKFVVLENVLFSNHFCLLLKHDMVKNKEHQVLTMLRM